MVFLKFISIAHRISHVSNVVVVSIQSNSRKKILLFANWLFTSTSFVPRDILWAMNQTLNLIQGQGVPCFDVM